jgi:hypothetical protein
MMPCGGIQDAAHQAPRVGATNKTVPRLGRAHITSLQGLPISTENRISKLKTQIQHSHPSAIRQPESSKGGRQNTRRSGGSPNQTGPTSPIKTLKYCACSLIVDDVTLFRIWIKQVGMLFAR